MGKIHQLSSDTISKIAAGEVIERPAYAVKELIDNAIDAQATYITLDIKDAGFTSITITDNGDGMDEEDIKLCFLPHTTSKLTDTDDLVGIQSLGFRGEALASIAAISTMTIKSRQKTGKQGTMVEMQQGELIRCEPIGAPVGTTITIAHLFSSVPARKKFLKSERTEFRHILEIVLQFALSYPDIRFFIRHNGKIVLNLPQQQDILERVALVMGEDIVPHIIPIKKEYSYLSIHGFLTKPQFAKPNNQKQFFFVNNRFIKNSLIRQAIKEAYGTLIEKTAHPASILFLRMPYETVDVNVHPRKEEIHFLDKTIFETIRNAVSEALSNHNLTYQHVPFIRQTKQGSTNSYAGQVLKNFIVADAPTTLLSSFDVMQLHNLYIITQTREGIVLIDQHAAHERIQYEKLKKAFATEAAKQEIEKLKKPLPIELALTEQEVLKEHQKMFEQLGFHIEFLHEQTYLITQTPKLFADQDLVKIIKDLLAENISEKKSVSLDRYMHTTLAYLACRSAIMAGQKLTKEQMKKLITDLAKTPNNTTCPHGRPTKIATNIKALHRIFKRNSS